MNAADPRDLARSAVDEMIAEGLKKHDDENWRTLPMSMHIQKGARHALTALLLMEHPTHTQDPESAERHIKQAICRLAFALAHYL